MSEKGLQITESDEAGNIIATYVQSPAGQDGLSRVDVIHPKDTKSIWQTTLDVFLPAGYPQSVTDDYLESKVLRISKDSLQAFSSSIASLLSSRAVLSSVGVGDSTASPTAALLLSILQESAGRIATILFAHRFGTSLEPECKMYRLLADILNDIAFVLDCLSPVFPKAIRVVILSFSSVLRSLCGVAAGSAKASLSAHFARWGNLGELNAKDSSQETVISLFGMLVGSLVVSWVTTPLATWTALILLLSIHLETNRRAVRAVSMRTLNRQRGTLVYHVLKHGKVPSPQVISAQERIFERGGVLRGADDRVLGYCHIGASMADLVRSMGSQQNQHTKSARVSAEAITQLFELFEDQKYILWVTRNAGIPHISVMIKAGATSVDVITAWWHALMVAEEAFNKQNTAGERKSGDDKLMGTLRLLEEMEVKAMAMLTTHRTSLEEAGWNLDVGAMETTSSVRITVAS